MKVRRFFTDIASNILIFCYHTMKKLFCDNAEENQPEARKQKTKRFFEIPENASSFLYMFHVELFIVSFRILRVFTLFHALCLLFDLDDGPEIGRAEKGGQPAGESAHAG